MSEFLAEPETPAESEGEDKPKIERVRINKKEIKKKLLKMFRAASNGKNYYKKWWPELKDTGDFEAAFVEELNKL